jgi:hypothetical protein
LQMVCALAARVIGTVPGGQATWPVRGGLQRAENPTRGCECSDFVPVYRI